MATEPKFSPGAPAQRDRPPCPNCGSQEAGSYCAECGQRQPTARDYSPWGLALAIFEEATSYDGRVWGSLRAVLFQPGALARDHFEGRRARHLSPFRVFVVANVCAWFLIPWLDITGFDLAYAFKAVIFPGLWERALAARASWSGIPVAVLKERIIALGSTEDAAAVLCMVPLFALGLTAALAGRGYRYVQHLVFAAHFYCVHLLSVLVMIGAVANSAFLVFKGHPDWAISAPAKVLLKNMWFIHSLSLPVLFPYLLVGIRRAYRLSSGEAWWRAAGLAVFGCTIARAFFDLAFTLVLAFA